MKKVFYLVFIAIHFFYNSYAQNYEWNIKKTYILDSLLFSYNKFELVGCKATDFKFLSYNYKDTTYFLDNIKELSISSRSNKFESNIELPKYKIGRIEKGQFISNYNEDLFIKINYYTQFIDSLEVILVYSCCNKQVKVSKLFHAKELTYQPINYWQLLDVNFDYRINDTAIYIKSINFRGFKSNNKLAKFIISDISLMSRESKEITAKDWKEEVSPSYSNVLIGKTFIFNKFTNQNLDILYCSDTSNIKREIEYTGSFVHKILENYKHYHLKNILKDSILKEHQILIENSINFDNYYTSLNKLLLRLEDPHLRINYPIRKYKNNIQPIYFKDILGDLVTVAVFDTTEKVIKPGTVIKKINNNDPLGLLNDFSEKEYGTNNSVRKEKALNKYFDNISERFPTDSVMSVVFLDQKKLDTALISLRRKEANKYVIPENFRFSNSYYYHKTNNISYIKIGEMVDELMVPYFLTYYDSLVNSNGIILDFRNNTGSDNCIFFLLSLFLNKPCPIFQISIEDLFNPFSKYVNYETYIIKPFILKLNKPLVILMNARTTCGAEMLIYGLKCHYRNEILTVGTESTAGAAQFINHIMLPNTNLNKEVVLTYYTNLTYVCGKDLDEIKGIYPDVKTSYYSYRDLAPYDDKLKRIGFDLLEVFQMLELK
jgi:C-terminal processing protease CtpA/Prc